DVCPYFSNFSVEYRAPRQWAAQCHNLRRDSVALLGITPFKGSDLRNLSDQVGLRVTPSAKIGPPTKVRGSYTDRPVAREVIDDCLRVAGSAPSGANMQPWHFVVVSDLEVKRKIRDAAEEEERLFYHGRAPQEWLDALAPLGTDENKPYLEAAPFLIVVFAQTYGLAPNGHKIKNYYVSESVGIATGMLISALHVPGLVARTHPPSQMGFSNRMLERPAREKPFLIFVVGLPAEDACVPDISKKTLKQIVTSF